MALQPRLREQPDEMQQPVPSGSMSSISLAPEFCSGRNGSDMGGTLGTDRPGPVALTPMSRTLIIACGALGRELTAIAKLNRLDNLTITCLPAIWHNTPAKIVPGLRANIREARGRFDTIICAYGDCGTGGGLDAMLLEEGVERIAGAHCYAFYAGLQDFNAMMEDEIGSFFLTDYLVRHFERLIFKGLGLDRFPQLRPEYFGNYRRVVYLAQTQDVSLDKKARTAATRLGLEFERRFTGYGLLPALLAPGKAVVNTDG